MGQRGPGGCGPEQESRPADNIVTLFKLPPVYPVFLTEIHPVIEQVADKLAENRKVGYNAQGR